MDDAQLKKFLGDAPVPPVDDNARKTALNLAMAEYEAAQAEERNKISPKFFQGSSLWGRLIGRTHPQRRESMEKKMNKKFVYGGMATAMVVVLAATVTLQNSGSLLKDGAGVSVAPVAAIERQHGHVAGLEIKREGHAQKSDMVVAEAEIATMQAAPVAPPLQGMPAPVGRRVPPMMANKMMAAESFAGAAMPSVAYMPEPMPQPGYYDVGRDQFEKFDENPVKLVTQDPVSTFSIDVDTSSYAFVRRQLNSGVLPQRDAVRVEEMVNYFDYDYPLPADKAQPFKPSVTVVPSPWHEGRKLLHIGIKGYDIAKTEAPDSNLVFLLDTSGSMNAPDRLPLLINSLKMMLETLKPTDTVSIVTYAGSAGTVLEPTKVSDKAKIVAALENLNAGGSTAGAEGIRQAYTLAEGSFKKEAINRVILATDGDFNVGITDQEELKSFIAHERDSGIFLSVLGFGQGNYNDSLMQALAQNGNGVASYIDTLSEGRKVLVEEASATLFPIAKDVKIQVEFNPATVAEYRLVGYETRKLNTEDFNNDKVDAGDIGAGHAVTAIYEITPVGGARAVDDSRYATAQTPKPTAGTGNEYAFLKIRYKLPDQDESNLITTPITAADEKPFANTKCPPHAQCLVADNLGASDDVRFSVAVASFGQMLKGGKNTGKLTYDDVINMAQAAKGADEFGYRAEFINLVRLAKTAPALPDTQP